VTKMSALQKPTLAPSFGSDDTANAVESAQSSSPEDVVRYMREARGG
jgi:hypothetical protein